jgi:hypothetical protein
LPPASFAFHAAAAELGVVARTLVEPTISVDWSVVWASSAQSGAIARLLESARRCSEENSWLSASIARKKNETPRVGGLS